MTGVNDAPALKEASIGIAMGRAGTEVTKEAADMVVTDDNFASIVAAVEEGRGIYENIAKTLAYLLAGNAGELAVMLVAALVGWPLPLLPIQLLWINLVTDGLPALGLATDPIDADVLSKPPRRPDTQLMDRGFVGRLAFVGSLTAAVTLVAFAYELQIDGNLEDARNAAFSVLVIAEFLRAFGARSQVRTVWEVGLLSNMRLFAIVAVSVGFQLVIHHQVTLASVFGTEPISLGQCVAWILLGAVPLVVIEAHKILTRSSHQDEGRSAATAPVQLRAPNEAGIPVQMWAFVSSAVAGAAAIVFAILGAWSWTGAALLVAVGAGVAARVGSHRLPAPMPHWMRWVLFLPRTFQSPEHLETILQPRPGERLLEIGPGVGIHALPMAVAVAPDGVVDVLDIQPAMLADLVRRATTAGIQNVRPEVGDARRLPYADASFDGAYLISVLGEVRDEPAALRELRRVLKRDGRLVVGEIAVDPDFIGLRTLKQRMAAAGFVFERRQGPGFAYLAAFRPA